MGTFVDYNGSMEIPEKKREEFLFRVQKIADLGSLMKLKKVSVHEREVLLLRPLELSKGGVAAGTTVFNFSYFEDDAWETARFSGKDLYLCSEKVGEREFYDAMIALYSLYALYDEDPGWVIDNGRRVSWNQSIGWINHLFGTKYCPKDVAPIEQKENAETEPFSEVTTSEYFRQTGYTAFWHMPGEERTEADYILTDDDRLYWWDGTDEVVISEDVITLLKSIIACLNPCWKINLHLGESVETIFVRRRISRRSLWKFYQILINSIEEFFHLKVCFMNLLKIRTKLNTEQQPVCCTIYQNVMQKKEKL